LAKLRRAEPPPGIQSSLLFKRNNLQRRNETALTFSHPLVILQSDDWGRVGVQDAEGYASLRSQAICLAAQPYDFYSLETRDDVEAVGSLLKSHHDSAGQSPRLVVNFCVANLDFAAMRRNSFGETKLLALSRGLPGNWSRPGLIETYREWIREG